MDLQVIVLAAGKGTRMRSARPKVLQTLAGKTLIRHVLDTCLRIDCQGVILVYGFGGEAVKKSLEGLDLIFAEQKEQLGTGHAVKTALPFLPKEGKSLILYGDVPLIQTDTLKRLIDANQNGISMITLRVDNPFGLGRIIRQDGKVSAIVEQKDANDAQKAVNEINSGIYCVDNALLHKYLPALDNRNAQGEYYLTDIVTLAAQDGVEITTIEPAHAFEIEGVNDRFQLAHLERVYQAYQTQQLQEQGVQFADPLRVEIRGKLSCDQDVFIDVGTIFVGDVHLGEGVRVDTGCVVANSVVGKNSHIKPYCVVDDSRIGEGVSVGPFAHLRPKTDLGDRAKVGNFVEIKKSTVGFASKINHLSYIGDAVVGEEVNIGAGVITCNYDGVQKWQTRIDDRAFVGSNASLVAPVRIGEAATVGAGSVITKDAPSDTLSLGRAKQSVVPGWKRPAKDDAPDD